jgi:hypothetical protein
MAELTEKDEKILREVQDDEEKRLNDDELDLVINLYEEGMSMEKILEKIFEERKKNQE